MAVKKKRAGGRVRRGPGSNTAKNRKSQSGGGSGTGSGRRPASRSGSDSGQARRSSTSRGSFGRKPVARRQASGDATSQQGAPSRTDLQKPDPKGRLPGNASQGQVQESQGDPGSLWGKVLEQARMEEVSSDQGLVRLNAYLAQCGVASRRKSDELIAAGRIQVDGKVVRNMGHKVDPLRQIVKVDSEILRPERPTYVLLNKPKNVVCTNSIHEQKLRAIDLLTGVKGRLFTVGRLDADSEGLLILTNDGSFADRMTHPRYEVAKTYSVVVRGRVEKVKLDKVRGGVWLSEGRVEGFQIRIKKRGKERSILEVTIREGRNREIRRVFARIGHPVLRLTRIRMGNLTVRGVSVGKWRFLKPQEISDLLKPTERHAAASSELAHPNRQEVDR